MSESTIDTDPPLTDRQQKAIASLMQILATRFGREPTEDEVFDFIMGNAKTRNYIWNKENN